MKKAQAERAAAAGTVNHPLAATVNGRIVCKVCQTPVASAALWPAHILSTSHLQVCACGGEGRLWRIARERNNQRF